MLLIRFDTLAELLLVVVGSCYTTLRIELNPIDVLKFRKHDTLESTHDNGAARVK